MNDREKAEYADVIWVTFLQRLSFQERPLFMSPLNWEVVKGWMDAEIPLRTVLRGIQDTGKAGASLAYYQPSVREAAENRLRALGPW